MILRIILALGALMMALGAGNSLTRLAEPGMMGATALLAIMALSMGIASAKV